MGLKLIYNNPYRILGVLSNSPLKERVGNQNRLLAFAKVGKVVDFPNDFALILTDKPTRTPESISAANTAINLDKDQLKYALFWFISGSPMDDIALKYLQAGNRDKAVEIFQKKESYSSLINIGVLAFIDGDNTTGFSNISKVIHNSTYRAELLQALGVANIQLSEDELAELVIAELLKEIPASKLLSVCNNTTDRAIISKSALDEPISAINLAISVAKNADSKNPEASLAAGTKLMNTTKAPLKAIKDIAGASSPQYQMVADNVAKQVLQCGINYYNNASEDENVKIEKAFTLQNYALSIAVGRLTKDRCKENADILKKKKEELPPKEAIYYDKKIKDALEVYMKQPDEISYAINLIKKVVPYLMSIKEVLGGNNTYYLRMSTLIVNASLYNIIEEFNSVMDDIQLQLDRAGTMRIIKNVFDQAWKAILYMDKLDMEPEFKRGRYNQNRSTLKRQVEKVINVYQTVSLDMRGEKKIFEDCRTVSDLNNYTSLFPGGKYATQVKDKMEKMEYDACTSTQDCQKFKNKYPRSRYDIDSKREECCYKQCRNISQYEGYLRDYPNGKYVTQAKANIDKLSYKSCRSVSDYRKYMSKFPHGKYFSQAKLFVDDEEMWSRCTSSDSKDLYKEYLAKFPNGRHKTEAERKASACYVATMVYGDYNHPQVVALRSFRDDTLQHSALGRAFIRFYYRNSPTWVEKMQGKKTINTIIRTILDIFIILYNHESK